MSSVEDNTGVGDNCSRPETAREREREKEREGEGERRERPTRLTAV